MDRVVLYGLGGIFRGYEEIFRGLQKDKKIHVIGAIDRRLQEGTSFHNYNILSVSEVVDMDIDYVIITAQDPVAKEIYADLCAAGVNKDKIVSVYCYTPIKEMLDRIINLQLPIQLEVIQNILLASDQEVASFDWMRKVVGRYGIYPLLDEDVDGIDDAIVTCMGMQQRPDEFTKYCMYLSNWNIDTAIEVGVFRGKSSYFMCALLARKNPKLVYNLVDIADNLDNFEEFHEILPQLRKRIPSTSENYIGNSYDFVFIDADHSYDASMRDYMNLGQYAKKLTVFHDIYAHEYDYLNGGTVRMWKEVVDMTPKHRHHIFSEYPNQLMGIGVLENLG